jgi:hypothetical protein
MTGGVSRLTLPDLQAVVLRYGAPDLEARVCRYLDGNSSELPADGHNKIPTEAWKQHDAAMAVIRADLKARHIMQKQNHRKEKHEPNSTLIRLGKLENRENE